MELNDLASDIIQNMVPEARLTAEDQAVITRNQDYLAGLTERIVQAFYDSAYAHPPTAAIFHEGERPDREQTLRDWWLRTISKPLDDSYYHWMTLVGVIHIRRRVKNPMMLSMLSHVTSYVSTQAMADLDPTTAHELAATLCRLQAVVGSLISDSYTLSYIASLENLAGFSPELSGRMLDLEVKRLSENFRQSLGTGNGSTASG
jgi:hypothetical protein